MSDENKEAETTYGDIVDFRFFFFLILYLRDYPTSPDLAPEEDVVTTPLICDAR